MGSTSVFSWVRLARLNWFEPTYHVRRTKSGPAVSCLYVLEKKSTTLYDRDCKKKGDFIQNFVISRHLCGAPLVVL